jgi:thiamine-phosphate pyrophosphorylase
MEMIPKDILRIIDANLNRAGEGLRVLEEFTRMSLNDATITQRLKNMRHEILVTDASLQEQLVRARDSENDVGADMKVAGQDEQRDTMAIIVANSRRIQESLRVLEETAKAYDTGIETDIYKRTRFELYTIEKELLSLMMREDKLRRLRGLYVIIDTEALGGRDHTEAVTKVIKAGAGIVQLRDKVSKKKELVEIGQRISDLCRDNGVLFIINDYLDLALAVDADGLHVGLEDLPPGIVRRLLNQDMILGCSIRTVEAAREAIILGANYLGVGGMFPTTSKKDNEVIGTAGLRAIRNAVDVPLVAIGGISAGNITEVIEAGADAIAVISAVLDTNDIEAATKNLLNIIEGGSRG